MTIQSLKLYNFRSYPENTFEFDAGVNLITGPNGSGKTNILEAIYFLGLTRSFRGLPAQAISHGERWFRVQAGLNNGDELALVWQSGQKQCVYNSQPHPPYEFIGTLPVVLFEPGAVEVVYGAPARRRQLLDKILSVTDETYLRSLLQLRRILKQRNSLLRQPRLMKDQVFGWDVLLVEQAAYVRRQRERLLEYMNQHVPDIYQRISGSDEITLTYSSRTDDGEAYSENLLTQLEGGVDQDYRYGFTRFGPHRDDVVIRQNNRLLADKGSRGEIRTATLSLVLAEFAYLTEHARSKPIILFDDVFSELDKSRQHRLLDATQDCQVIITSTELPTALKNGYNHIQL